MVFVWDGCEVIFYLGFVGSLISLVEEMGM